MQRFDDLHIDESFDPVWFRLPIFPHASGKVDQLRSKLVAWFEGTYAGLPVDGNGGFQAADIFVCRLDAHPAFRPHDFIHGGIRRAEAAGEGGQAIVGKRRPAPADSSTL